MFKLLTIRGIYGREMYETWYKMTVMLQSGLDITPAITDRFGFRDHEAAFAAARSGDSGKVILDWVARDRDPRRPRDDRRPPEPPRLSSTTSWRRCASATCTGRCA